VSIRNSAKATTKPAALPSKALSRVFSFSGGQMPHQTVTIKQMNKEIFLARLRRWVRDIGDQSEEYQHDNEGFEAFELRITDEEPTGFAGWIANGSGEEVGRVMTQQLTVDTVTVYVRAKDKTIWLSDCVTWLADLAGVQPPIDIDTVLTERQIEIAHLLADGMDDRGIADRLTLSKRTIKKHRENIQKRWGIAGGLVVLQRETKRRGYGRA